MEKKFESQKRTFAIKHLIIHSFALTPEKMLKTLHQYGLSVHYLIEADGTVHTLVPEERIAWHAGLSFWAGETSLNQTSIGIELEHLQYGQTDYPKAQIKTLIKLVKDILKRHHIRPENILGHSDIAPAAKSDPGRGFPWKKLAQNGIGLWYDLKNKMPNLKVQELLEIVGYQAQTERQLKAAAWAFCQRFIPEATPIDLEIAEREKKVFKARQKAAQLPENKRIDFLKSAPVIYPENINVLENPKFMDTLRAVAYQYQQARENLYFTK